MILQLKKGGDYDLDWLVPFKNYKNVTHLIYMYLRNSEENCFHYLWVRYPMRYWYHPGFNVKDLTLDHVSLSWFTIYFSQLIVGVGSTTTTTLAHTVVLSPPWPDWHTSYEEKFKLSRICLMLILATFSRDECFKCGKNWWEPNSI